MHRDIKPDNIIRGSGKGDWKLCDYGLSRLLGRDDYEIVNG